MDRIDDEQFSSDLQHLEKSYSLPKGREKCG
jgi:hypothetical protein